VRHHVVMDPQAFPFEADLDVATRRLATPVPGLT
jgi:hypothetical protein